MRSRIRNSFGRLRLQLGWLGLGIVLSTAVASAQTPPPDVTRPGDKPAPVEKVKPAPVEKAKPVTVTVKILVVPAAGKASAPASRAVVRVEGAEDALETNDKGVAKLAGIVADRIKLQIIVPGADICRPPDLPVAAKNRVVEVHVEKWAGGQCKLKIVE